jgi:23S rRNA pseudouridine1911/1915/1917 synthase
MSEEDLEFGPIERVFEDEDLAVIEKPAGLVVHPSPSHQGPTLVDLMEGEIGGGGDPGRPGIVHRLDRGTSGLMVVAKNDTAHRRLQEMIQGREVGRTYLALAGGHLRSRTGRIDAPIGRDPRHRHRMAVNGASPRSAATRFEVIDVFPVDSLLEVSLETGRTHQIRVHMAAIGNPLVGDPTYGGREDYGLERPFLHSSRLAFDHPSTGERIDVQSELPEDLRVALDMARSG